MYTKATFEIPDYFGVIVAFFWFCGVTWLFSITFLKYFFAEKRKPTTNSVMEILEGNPEEPESSKNSSQKQ